MDLNATTAFRIWQRLIVMAESRQTIRYGQLSRKVGYSKPGQAIARPLGYIMVYCEVRRLPHLSVLVVSEATGLPNRSGIPWVKNPSRERERVYDYPWVSEKVEIEQLQEARNLANDAGWKQKALRRKAKESKVF